MVQTGLPPKKHDSNTRKRGMFGEPALSSQSPLDLEKLAASGKYLANSHPFGSPQFSKNNLEKCRLWQRLSTVRFPSPLLRAWQFPRLLAAILTTSSVSSAVAGEPAGYYSGVTNQTGASLRAALHSIIDGHTALTYTDTREALRSIDEDTTNAANVILVYSRRSEPKANFAPISSPTVWNREHLWPNSLGIDSNLPAYSDLFNLRPADLDVNNRRANLLFDETNSDQGPVVTDPEAPLCTRDADSWEVPALVKGDIARSMFYMDLRYEGGQASEPNLILTDKLNEVSTTGSKFGRLTTLLLWHASDPVDAVERKRNDDVFAFQKNRNPFVDRPELVGRVYADPLILRVEVQGPRVKLSWWESLTRAPQQSGNLLQWGDATGTFATEGEFRSVEMPIFANRQFFRLRYQAPDVP